MDKLTKKYNNVYGTIISDALKDIIKKYSDNKKIKFLELMPQKKVI